MFKKGDIITGRKNSKNYSYTNENALMLVIKTDDYYNDMQVCMLANNDHEDDSFKEDEIFEVENLKEYFAEISIENYFKEYPNAKKNDEEVLEYIFNEYDINSDILNRLFNKEDVKPYILSDKQRAKLIKEMEDLLKTYDYHPTQDGLNVIIDKWAKQKKNLIELFEKHPNYNGKFQIVFDMDMERKVDDKIIRKVIEYFYYSNFARDKILKKLENISVFTYEESYGYYKKYRNICDIFRTYKEVKTVNGISYNEAISNMQKWREILEEYESCGVKYNGTFYTRESYKIYENFKSAMGAFKTYRDNKINDWIKDEINYWFPEMKVVVGQKTSRVMNKLCKMLGLNEDPNYNREFAKYSDAINPLMIKRHTILSIHPIDYYTMSFGNSWSSCHTIDKENIRCSENNYHGAYSGGTESYMLDKTSFIFYTVDASYNGNKYELENKINRNMFHYGYNKLIQGRVYPQANDEDSKIYQNFREIVQKIISECLKEENSWLVSKGTSACGNVTISKGVHYRDYMSYSDCNVSYHKKEKDLRKIIIGHNPICPHCGKTHRNEEYIECYDCRSDY